MLKLIKNSDTALKYLLATVLVAVPLYPKFPFMRIPGTFVSVRLEDFLLAISFLLFAMVVVLSGEYKKMLRMPITIAVIFYLIAGFLSVVSSIYVTQTTVSHIAFLHLVRRIEYFTPFFMGYYLIIIDRRALDYFVKIIIAVLIFAFIYGAGQKYLNWPIIITQNEEYAKGVALRWLSGSHINSTFAGHYDLASYLVLVMPFLVAYFFLTSAIKEKIAIGLSYFGGMWLMVNSASRISLVSYLISVTAALFIVKKYKQIPLVIIISLAFIGFSTNLLSRYSRIFQVTLNKVGAVVISDINAQEEGVDAQTLTPTPVPVVEDRSTNIRLNVEWPRAIRALKKNPLLGTGYSSITLATDNDYLRALGETGVLGFVSLGLVFIALAVNFFGAYPFTHLKGLELAFVAGIIGSLVGIFINAVFIDVFEASKFAINYWILLGLSQGLVVKKNG